MIKIEPTPLTNFDSYIEKSPTFQRYKSQDGLKSSYLEYNDNVYSVTVFNQMGNIDVFTHDLSNGITGMSGQNKIPRNTDQSKCDMLANLILKKIVRESTQLYKKDYKI